MEKNEMNEKNVKAAGAVSMVANEVNVFEVTRELLNVKTSNGGDMYAYVVRDKLTVNGVDREFKAEFGIRNNDVAGYEMLDIIFMFGEVAYLTVGVESMYDENTKRTTEYETYEIWNCDEEGITYSYKVRPRAESDRAKLSVIRQRKFLKLANAAEAAENAQKAETVEKSKK